MFVSFLYMKLDIKIIQLPAWTAICHKDILLDVGTMTDITWVIQNFTFVMEEFIPVFQCD